MLEWYYYALIIIGIGLGLIIVYIVLRNQKIIGPIPILSNVIDPLSILYRRPVYFIKGTEDSLSEGLTFIWDEQLITGKDARKIESGLHSGYDLSAPAKEYSINNRVIHELRIDNEKLENMPKAQRQAEMSDLHSSIWDAIKGGEVVILRNRDFSIDREIIWKSKKGYNYDISRYTGKKNQYGGREVKGGFFQSKHFVRIDEKLKEADVDTYLAESERAFETEVDIRMEKAKEKK